MSLHGSRGSIGGATVNATITSVGKIALIVFDGTAGSKSSVGISAGGVVETDTWVFHSQRDPARLGLLDNNGRDIQIESLPVTGTYTIRLAPRGFSTGTKPITLSQDLDRRAHRGGRCLRAREHHPARPAGATHLRGDSRAEAEPRLPRGERLRRHHRHEARRDDLCDVPRQHRPQHRDAATADHRHLRDLVDPRYADTRNMTLTLSEEISGSIVVDGSALPLTLARVGQVARVTFSATAAQRLNLAVTNANLSTALTILKPDGTSWVTTSVSNNSVVDTAPAPTTGTYTIVLDPGATMHRQPDAHALRRDRRQHRHGRLAGLGLHHAARAEGAPALQRDGDAAGEPQHHRRDGQRYRLCRPAQARRLGDQRLPNWSQTTFFGPGSGFLGAYTLPTTRTYAVYLAPGGPGTGGRHLHLYNVTPDVTGTADHQWARGAREHHRARPEFQLHLHGHGRPGRDPPRRRQHDRLRELRVDLAELECDCHPAVRRDVLDGRDAAERDAQPHLRSLRPQHGQRDPERHTPMRRRTP